jgi:hypothetical protein
MSGDSGGNLLDVVRVLFECLTMWRSLFLHLEVY